jgi:Family of unknown function (DUF5923)
MGNLLSFCKKNKRQEDELPLLDADREELPQLTTGLEKLFQSLGAFSAGKLPSERQLEYILRKALNSGLLLDEAFLRNGPLSDRGQKVLQDLREVIEAILQLGMEKNCK